MSISLPETAGNVRDLVHRQASEPQIENLSLKTPKSNHKSSIELQLEAVESKLRTVQLSLEILTGVCAILPDPEPDLKDEGNENEGLLLVVLLSFVVTNTCVLRYRNRCRR